MNQKFQDKLQTFLMPFSTWVASNNILTSFGEGISAALPLIMLGSIAVVLASLPFDAYKEWITAHGIRTCLQAIQNLSLGLVGLYSAGTIAFRMAEKTEVDTLSNTIVAIAAFIICQGYTPGSISTSYLGASGLFLAMILGVAVPLFSKFCMDKKLYVRLPDGVPPVVERSFAAMVPAMLILTSFGVVQWLVSLTSFATIPAFVYSLLQKPFSAIGLSIWGYSAVNVIADAAFFCGIHGSSINSILSPILTAASSENLDAFALGLQMPNIISNSFNAYINIGGAGCTFGLQICMMLFGKSKRVKTLNKITLIPSIFNCNEPLLFGLPIMLNPVMFIPYVGIPVLYRFLSFFLTSIGVLPVLNGMVLTWTIPPVIRVALSGGGWIGVLYVVILTVASAFLYLPFFRIVDNQYLQQEKALENNQSM